jgi:hypothetical protein
MTIKTLLTTAALVLAPAMAAQAACSGHSQQAMSCGEGSQWNADKGECVVVTG